MSGLVLTSVSPTPEKSIDRSSQPTDAERSSKGFDEVSAREQSRLDAKAARQDRMQQQRAEQQAHDDRVADKRAEKSEAQDRANDSAKGEQAEHGEEASASKAEGKADENQDQASRSSGENDEADETNNTGEKDDADKKGDEVLPGLFAVPPSVNPVKGGSVGITAGQSAMPTSGSSSGSQLNNLMLKPMEKGAASSGQDGTTEGMLSGKGDQLSSLMGKVAGGDAKAADFSAQLARFQGGDSQSNGLQSNAASLQRGLEGRESMASLKSYSTSIDLPVQHAEWGEKIAGKLAWLTNQRMSTAEIHVTPPDLGPLDVRVQVHHDQAQVAVHATHAAVRDQLELNGNRLRDMLQENGLNLDRFEVSADASGQGAQQQLSDEGAGGSGSGGNGAGVGDGDLPDETLASGSLDLSWRGEVDLYA